MYRRREDKAREVGAVRLQRFFRGYALRAAIDTATIDRNADKLKFELRTAIEDGVSKSSDIAAEARALIKAIEESESKRKDFEDKLRAAAEKGKAALASEPRVRKIA